MSNEYYDVTKLNYIREHIENMSKFNQLGILRILNNNKEVIINENKYGIHVNLSDIEPSVLKQLMVYIDYVNNQEMYLKNDEKAKETYKNTFFCKDNKDIST